MLPPHPPQSYDSLLPKHQQYAALQRFAEAPEERAATPSPIPFLESVAEARQITSAFDPNTCLDPAIIESDALVASIAKKNPRPVQELRQHATMTPDQSNPEASSIVPASRFSLASKAITTRPNVTARQAPSTAPAKWLTDTITRLEAEVQKLQEQLDDTKCTIQVQSTKIKTLRVEMNALHKAQSQNKKEIAGTHTNLQTISAAVTDVVGRLETIDVNMNAEAKPIVERMRLKCKHEYTHYEWRDDPPYKGGGVVWISTASCVSE
jgi:regulator of replication initiation timing